jgi:S-formylglutathione hydrolase
MSESSVVWDELKSRFMPGLIPCAALLPPAYNHRTSLPLCLLLMGGGGTRQSLIDLKPAIDGLFAEGLEPMIFATPTAGMSYYFDDPDTGTNWQSFLIDDFIPHLRQRFNTSAPRNATAIAGISMGGYGALKFAFARPDVFGIVTAIQPILEPAFNEKDIRPRNRLHHIAGGPSKLIGKTTDPAQVEAANPANRLRANARAIAESNLAIYIEAGDDDFINAHDGAEFLHRTLWDLDISHEYRLLRGADHGGPTLLPRIKDALRWTGRTLNELRHPPAPDPFLTGMRSYLHNERDNAAAKDETMHRRYGILPGPN